MPETGGPVGGLPAARMAALAGLAQSALERATDALLDGGEHAPEQLAAADRELHELLDGIEETAAGQSVADLRALVAGVHLGNELEGVAELVRRIAALAWTRHEAGTPLPARLRLPLRALAAATLGLLDSAVAALAAGATADLSGSFAELATRQRRLYQALLEDRSETTADTAEAVLLACHLRHCADHALTLAAHAELVAPGQP